MPKLMVSCLDKDIGDKSGSLPVCWGRSCVCLLAKSLSLIVINHRASLKWNKTQCKAYQEVWHKHNVLFSDRKTRLRWCHLSRCNKAPRCACDKLETHNKDWQSWRENTSLILPNVKHKRLKWQIKKWLLVFPASALWPSSYSDGNL